MYTLIEERIKQYGLVDIESIDKSIIVNLKYATSYNFMGEVLYDEIFRAFLVDELATRVVKAHQSLRKNNNELSIIIYDAARPISIQKKMYERVKNTSAESYVANPYNTISGGFHNYGMAVDLSIVDSSGKALDMGSSFDSFGEKSHTDFYNMTIENRLLKEGKISQEAYNNRKLLYAIMGEQDLLPIPREWWHYQYHQKEEDKLNYKLLDF